MSVHEEMKNYDMLLIRFGYILRMQSSKDIMQVVYVVLWFII